MSQICQTCSGQEILRDPYSGLSRTCRGCTGESHMIHWEEILDVIMIHSPAPADPFILAGFTPEQSEKFQVSAREISETTGLSMSYAMESMAAAARTLSVTAEQVTSWISTLSGFYDGREREQRIRSLAYRKERSQGRNKRRRRP